MEFEQIALERHGPVEWVILDRPDDLNCLSPIMLNEIGSALDRAQADASVRCVVLMGRGRAFCAGADLKFVADMPPAERDAATARFLRDATDVVARIEAFPKPVIAAVNGIATAGGMEIILGCDIVVAAAGARLGDGHANYGLLPGAGGSARLPRRLGLNHAKRLMFTGDLLPASDSIFAQLINMIVPDSELVDKVGNLASTIAKKSPLGLAAMKRLANAAVESRLFDAIEAELEANAAYVSSYDRNEGLAAFRERRSPNFKGV